MGRRGNDCDAVRVDRIRKWGEVEWGGNGSVNKRGFMGCAVTEGPEFRSPPRAFLAQLAPGLRFIFCFLSPSPPSYLFIHAQVGSAEKKAFLCVPMASHAPNNHPYGAYSVPQHQQHAYTAQQPPMYNPHAQQWGHQQNAHQQYFTAPAGPSQVQPITGVMPPSYETAPYGTVNPESGLPAKFNPRPRYNDCWAFLLFIAQLAAFVVLSYFALRQIDQDRKNDNSGYYSPGRSPYSPAAGFFSISGLVTMLISILTGLVIAVLYFMLTQA